MKMLPLEMLYESARQMDNPILKGIADCIKDEVDEKYMPLPLDADGVPIHIGDEMVQNDKRIGRVTAVGFHAEPRVWVLPHGCYVSIVYMARGIVHYKPRTVEDVLGDVAREIYADAGNEIRDMDFIIAKYAAELQMREGGA